MTKLRKVICIVGVAVLLSLYGLSFISALFYQKGFNQIFNAAVYSTVVVPVFLYAMLLMHKVISNKSINDELSDQNNDNSKQ